MNWIPYVEMAGRAKENLPGGSLRYQFVYLKVRIFKCSYRMLHIAQTETEPIHYKWRSAFPAAYSF